MPSPASLCRGYCGRATLVKRLLAGFLVAYSADPQQFAILNNLSVPRKHYTHISSDLAAGLFDSGASVLNVPADMAPLTYYLRADHNNTNYLCQRIKLYRRRKIGKTAMYGHRCLRAVNVVSILIILSLRKVVM